MSAAALFQVGGCGGHANPHHGGCGAHPPVLEVQNLRNRTDEVPPSSIGMLVGPHGSSALVEATARLQSGATFLAELVSESERRAKAVRNTCRAKVRCTLKYRGQSVVSLDYSPGMLFRGAQVSFCGAQLSFEAYSVEYLPSPDTDLEAIAVVENPRLSPVEVSLTEAVPFKISFMAPQWIGSNSGLMIMEEGWAIGGFLAKIAVLRQRRRWLQMDSGTPDLQAGGQPSAAIPPAANVQPAISANRRSDLCRHKGVPNIQS